uniref:Protein Wnt n=1 Tax=Macrostomum lignano TaxID=282301 RepID=A0A1I8F340_9PLAT
MGTLVSLSRPAQKSGGRGRHAVAFFASLYAVFARHHASVLGDDIRQMLISMINANLAFAEHLLDFLDSVTQDFPDSDLPYQAYSELCDWVAINSAENAADRHIEDSNLWLCGHLILDVSRSVFRTHWHRLQTDAGLLANLCGVLAHWAGPGDSDLYVDIDKNFVITDQSGAMSHRTRTSLAVAAPTASQAMPEMRLLAEPPVELNLLTEQSGLDCELTNSDAETVLIVPVRLTRGRSGREASRIATVDTVHLPRLRLPTPSDQSASESLVEVNIGLRVACHRRRCRFFWPSVSTAHPGWSARPLTAQPELDPAGLSRSTSPVAKDAGFESGVLNNGLLVLAGLARRFVHPVPAWFRCVRWSLRTVRLSLRLSIKSLPTLDLLTFRVIEANGESSSLSRDACAAAVRFDRYLKSLFGAAEEAVEKETLIRNFLRAGNSAITAQVKFDKQKFQREKHRHASDATGTVGFVCIAFMSAAMQALWNDDDGSDSYLKDSRWCFDPELIRAALQGVNMALRECERQMRPNAGTVPALPPIIIYGQRIFLVDCFGEASRRRPSLSHIISAGVTASIAAECKRSLTCCPCHLTQVDNSGAPQNAITRPGCDHNIKFAKGFAKRLLDKTEKGRDVRYISLLHNYNTGD